MSSELTLPTPGAPPAVAGAQPEPLLAVDGVSKVLGGRVAIEDVSFGVHPREFVAVLGPSGAGKTTLFKCMTGLMAPDRGSVRVAGLDVRALRGQARRRVAVVF